MKGGVAAKRVSALIWILNTSNRTRLNIEGEKNVNKTTKER
jgi:hypothetical protein